MGALAKALSNPSAYAAKKTTAWADITDRIAGAILPAELDAIETELEVRPLDYPGGWYGELFELVDKKREELAEEDISAIMRDRYDF